MTTADEVVQKYFFMQSLRGDLEKQKQERTTQLARLKDEKTALLSQIDSAKASLVRTTWKDVDQRDRKAEHSATTMDKQTIRHEQLLKTVALVHEGVNEMLQRLDDALPPSASLADDKQQITSTTTHSGLGLTVVLGEGAIPRDQRIPTVPAVDLLARLSARLDTLQQQLAIAQAADTQRRAEEEAQQRTQAATQAAMGQTQSVLSAWTKPAGIVAALSS